MTFFDEDETLPQPAPQAVAVVSLRAGGGGFYASSYELDDIGIVATGLWSGAHPRLVGAPEQTILFPWSSVAFVNLLAAPEHPEPDDDPLLQDLPMVEYDPTTDPEAQAYPLRYEGSE